MESNNNELDLTAHLLNQLQQNVNNEVSNSQEVEVQEVPEEIPSEVTAEQMGHSDVIRGEVEHAVSLGDVEAQESAAYDSFTFEPITTAEMTEERRNVFRQQYLGQFVTDAAVQEARTISPQLEVILPPSNREAVTERFQEFINQEIRRTMINPSVEVTNQFHAYPMDRAEMREYFAADNFRRAIREEIPRPVFATMPDFSVDLSAVDAPPITPNDVIRAQEHLVRRRETFERFADQAIQETEEVDEGPFTQGWAIRREEAAEPTTEPSELDEMLLAQLRPVAPVEEEEIDESQLTEEERYLRSDEFRNLPMEARLLQYFKDIQPAESVLNAETQGFLDFFEFDTFETLVTTLRGNEHDRQDAANKLAQALDYIRNVIPRQIQGLSDSLHRASQTQVVANLASDEDDFI